jgi:hypothetical protein
MFDCGNGGADLHDLHACHCRDVNDDRRGAGAQVFRFPLGLQRCPPVVDLRHFCYKTTNIKDLSQSLQIKHKPRTKQSPLALFAN